MTKFKLYFDKDKETEWLNEMAEQGHAMTGFFLGFYRFERCSPGEYIYQIDITPGLYRVTDDYREFMEETGVEIVALWGYWVILRKKANEGRFELYTDADSMIHHYQKIRKMFAAVTILEIICFLGEVFAAVSGTDAAFGAMALIGVFTVVMLRMIWKTNRIILKLREQKGETVS